MAKGAYKAPRPFARRVVAATLAAVLVCLSTVATQAAQGDSTKAVEAGSKRTALSETGTANPYADFNNEQLAGLADVWQELDRDQRRWFFVEVRKRLVAKGGPPRIPIRSSARFGQVVRDRAGSVVRVDTVRVSEPLTSRPLEPKAGAEMDKDPRAYGLGFERRTAVRRAQERQSVVPRQASGTSRAVRPPPQGGH